MGKLELFRAQRGQNGSRHLTYGKEKLAECYAEGVELLHLHWQEIAPYQDLLTLNPDMDIYRTAEEKGTLHIITARDNGKLVGYIILMVHRHLHYKHVLIATDDIHFLHPDYRQGGAGVRLFMSAEKEMRKLGVKILVMRTKANHDHGVLFERLGYSALDRTFSKRLDDGI